MLDRRDFELFRAFVPRWAHDPLSGAGAARFGGRWNPVGAPAFYGALELSTAWAEYNQSLVQHPALIVTFRLIGAMLADLTDPEVLGKLDLDEAIHRIEWRAIREDGGRPETDVVREKLLGERFDGLIYPSVMSRGGRCVALWRWNGPRQPRLVAVDPEGRLPTSPASWL